MLTKTIGKVVGTIDTQPTVDTGQIRADCIDELEEKLNNTGAKIKITSNFPIEEIHGGDIDLDDLAMVVKVAVQAYKKMVLEVLEQLKDQNK